MTQKSKYVIQKTDKSTCPLCGNKVRLLCDENMRKGKPAFYICFKCEFVGEIGVGDVHTVKDK